MERIGGGHEYNGRAVVTGDHARGLAESVVEGMNVIKHAFKG